MLYKRIIASLTLTGGIAVQSIGFTRRLPLGRPDIAAKFLDSWGVDEIVALDIDATFEGRGPDTALASRIADSCFTPLTFGGGVRSVRDVRELLLNGADKVAVNSAILERPGLLEELAERFGSQCIVASIDYRKNDSGVEEVFSCGGQVATGRSPADWAREVEALGAGEILLRSIDRDGAKSGFDLALAAGTAGEATIPVIIGGGAGNPEHFAELFAMTQASAGAAGNCFHFTEHSVASCKAYLLERGVRVRRVASLDYQGAAFDSERRQAKRPEEMLNTLRFRRIPKEIL